MNNRHKCFCGGVQGFTLHDCGEMEEYPDCAYLEEGGNWDNCPHGKLSKYHAEYKKFIAAHTQPLLDKLTALEKDKAVLAEFARHMICKYAWSYGDVDGGDVQDVAEKLGLITSFEITEDNIGSIGDPEFMEVTPEIGSLWYQFTDLLKEQEDADQD